MTTQEAVDVVELYIVGTGGAKEPISGDAALTALRALEAVIERLTKKHNDQVIENSYTIARLESAQFKLDNMRDERDAARALASRLAMGQEER